MKLSRRKFILRNGLLVPFVALAPRIAFPQVLLQGRKEVRFPPSYGLPSGDLLVETFEGSNSGYDLTSWTAIGVVNPDYTVTNIGDTGAQSLLVTEVASSSYVEHSISSSSSISARFKLSVTSQSTDVEVFAFRGAGVAIATAYRQNSNGHILCLDNSNNHTSDAGVSSTATTYYVWIYHSKGSGSNAVTRIAFSTTQVRPSWVTVSDGTGTTNCDLIRLGNANGRTGVFVIDDVNVFAGDVL